MEEEKQYARTQDVPVELVGKDGNVYGIIGTVRDALRRAGFKDEAKAYSDACFAGFNDEAKAYSDACFACHSYDEVLRLTMDTVDVQ